MDTQDAPGWTLGVRFMANLLKEWRGLPSLPHITSTQNVAWEAGTR